MKMLDISDEISNQYQIAELYNNLDVTDTYYIDEVNYCYNNMLAFYDKVAETAKAIIASPAKSGVEKIWGKEVTDYYEEYKTNTKEQNDLLARQQELLLEYNEAANEVYSTNIKNKTYTMADLVLDNTLSDAEYEEVYNNIMKEQNKVLGDIFVDLVKVRQKLAKLCGYNSYTEYCYKELYDRDYTPKDTLKINEEVKEEIVPLYKMMMGIYDNEAAEELDLRISNISPNEQFNMIEKYLGKVSAGLLESYQYMKRNNLYSVDYSKNKLDTGYTIFINKYQVPFLYNKPSFAFYDLTSLVHEFGHFNAYYTNYKEVADYENIDLAEIHSQGLEFLYTHFYKDMLGEKDGKAADEYVILYKLDAIVQGCLYDEFQQEVYALKDPSLEAINRIFSKLQKDYGVVQEEDAGYNWVLIPHNYQQPFYYISYTMSALPSFEIWEHSLKDFNSACSIYLKLIDKGESTTYKETLKKCGLNNPFTQGYLENLSKTLKSYYNLK